MSKKDLGTIVNLAANSSDDVFLQAREAIAQARLLLCDLDGCLVYGTAAAEGAGDFIARHLDKIRIVSNNSAMTPAACSRWLHRIGMKVPAKHIFLAGAFGLERLSRTRPGARVRLVGSRPLKNHARAMGLQLVDTNPDVVFLAKHLSMRFEAVSGLADATARGASLIVANFDGFRPVGHTAREVETGVQLAAIRAYAPDLPFEVVGKPQAALFQAALAEADCRPEDALMLGDTYDTDAVGALALKISTILVDSQNPSWPRLR